MAMPTNIPQELFGGSVETAEYKRENEWIFEFIPTLKDLLPEYRGRPGFYYAQIPTGMLRAAQDAGWDRLERTAIYSIIGPKGQVDMELVVRGRPIPGQSPDAGARLCMISRSVEEITGLEIPVLGEAGKKEEVDDGEESHAKGGPKSRKSAE